MSPVRVKVILPKLNSPLEKAIRRMCSPGVSWILGTVLVAQTSQEVVEVDGTVMADEILFPSSSNWNGPPPAAFPDAYLKAKE